MRLGGPVLQPTDSPEAWVEALRRRGYRAAFCPVGADADAATVNAYVSAAAAADIVIAEVGAWSNPLSDDPAERAAALDKCRRQLDLADRVGARCCVNIAGSRNPEKWDGSHPDNLTEETFERIVQSVREIVDSVQPTRTFYTLETMPWIEPISPDGYLDLIRAVDRERFAVHLDPVNIINCPERLYRNGALIRDCFDKLGPYIKGCHAKDVHQTGHFLFHVEETRIGTGVLDYHEFMRGVARLAPDTPVLLEHLKSEEDYAAAAAHVRRVAAEEGIEL